MYLELAEVQSVASAPPVQVGTKKIDEKAFFDVSSLNCFTFQQKYCTLY